MDASHTSTAQPRYNPYARHPRKEVWKYNPTSMVNSETMQIIANFNSAGIRVANKGQLENRVVDEVIDNFILSTTFYDPHYILHLLTCTPVQAFCPASAHSSCSSLDYCASTEAHRCHFRHGRAVTRQCWNFAALGARGI